MSDAQTTADPAQRFAEALQRFEQEGDLDAFVDGAFSEDVTLLRPEQEQELTGHEGARRFWEQYAAQFERVRSTFQRVQTSGDLGVLEWRSEATGRTGNDFSYRGVSLLDLDGEGKVRRFATYFDTAAFLSSPPRASAS